MNKTITLRITKRSQPLLAKVEEIAKLQPVGKDQFAPMLLDILELGLNSYESGNRVAGGEIINTENTLEDLKMTKNRIIAEQTHTPSIKNEVAKTLYPTLCGLIVSLEYAEEAKELPNKNRLSLYKEISDILMKDHRSFHKFTDKEIAYKVSILSPIIKKMVASEQAEHHVILENNLGFIKQLEYIEKVA